MSNDWIKRIIEEAQDPATYDPYDAYGVPKSIATPEPVVEQPPIVPQQPAPVVPQVVAQPESQPEPMPEQEVEQDKIDLEEESMKDIDKEMSIADELQAEVNDLNNQLPEQSLVEKYRSLIDQYRSNQDEARQSRNKLDLYGGIMDAGESVAKGFAKMYGGDLERSKTGDMLRKLGLQGIDDVTSDRKTGLQDIALEQKAKQDMLASQDAGMKREELQALHDFSSPQSKMYQDLALKLAPGLNEEQIRQINGATLTKMIPGLQTLANAQARKDAMAMGLKKEEMRQGLKKEGEDRRQLEQEVKFASNFLKQDPRFKKTIEQGSVYQEVDTLIDSVASENNEAALAALGTKLARAMGEVGVLTDADVVRYLGSRSWGRKILEWQAGGMQGTLPEDSIRELKKNTKFFRDKVNTEIDEIYDNAEKRLVDVYKGKGGITPERAKELVGPRPFNTDKKASTEKTVAKKQYSPSRNKTKIIYSDGSEEIIDGRQ